MILAPLVLVSREQKHLNIALLNSQKLKLVYIDSSVFAVIQPILISQELESSSELHRDEIRIQPILISQELESRGDD